MITASLELLEISKIAVPPDLNITLFPAASNIISATESNVMSPELDDASVTPV